MVEPLQGGVKGQSLLRWRTHQEHLPVAPTAYRSVRYALHRGCNRRGRVPRHLAGIRSRRALRSRLPSSAPPQHRDRVLLRRSEGHADHRHPPGAWWAEAPGRCGSARSPLLLHLSRRWFRDGRRRIPYWFRRSRATPPAWMGRAFCSTFRRGRAPRDEHDRGRAFASALHVHLAAPADIDQFTGVVGAPTLGERRGCHSQHHGHTRCQHHHRPQHTISSLPCLRAFRWTVALVPGGRAARSVHSDGVPFLSSDRYSRSGGEPRSRKQDKSLSCAFTRGSRFSMRRPYHKPPSGVDASPNELDSETSLLSPENDRHETV